MSNHSGIVVNDDTWWVEREREWIVTVVAEIF